jgi:hypothetical protein
MMLFSIIHHSCGWWTELVSLGIPDNDIEVMTDNVKDLSNWLKVHGSVSEETLPYIELAGICGYRTLPFPGFDMEAESRKLANAGIKHNWTREEFISTAEEVLLVTPRKWNPRLSFREYLESYSWVTAGSSSVGHLEITLADETIRVKARKNMVPFIYTIDELYSMCQDWTGQINYVLEKNELGKVRLAVASDLCTYLMMSYVNYCASEFYKSWDHGVSGESAVEQYTRMADMLELCRTNWGMPFDYKAFDHQPETWEIQAIVSIMIRIAGLNCDDSDLRWISATIINGFDHAEQITRISKLKKANPEREYLVDLILRILGGLSSGLLITALVGTGWNLVATKINLKRNAFDLPRYSKGDDTSLYSPDSSKLQRVEHMFRELNVEGGVGKYSILWGQNEFLRTWFRDRCYGYANRVIPGLMQQKPWSNTPWTGAHVLESIYRDVQILRRRLTDTVGLERVWQATSRIWMSKHSLPYAALSIPQRLGGLGLGVWDGLCRLTRPIPRLPKSKITLDNGVTDYFNYVNKKYAANGIVLSAVDTTTLNNELVNSTMSADDVRGKTSTSLRLKWNEEVKKLRPRVVPMRSDIRQLPTPKMLPAEGNALTYSNLFKSSYGSLRKEVDLLLELKPALAITKRSIKDVLMNEPGFHKLRDRYNLEPNPHLGEFLDWYGGNVPFSSTSVNPLGMNMYINWCVYPVRFFPKRGYLAGRIGMLAPLYCEGLWCSTPWYRSLNLW